MRAQRVGLSRIVIAAAVICVGVAGGIYVGYELLGTAMEPEAVEAAASEGRGKAHDPTPTVAAGDRFPPIGLAAPSDTMLTLFDVVYGRRTVLIALTQGCGRCDDLLSYWKSQIEPIQAQDIRVVLASPDYGEPYSGDKGYLADGKRVVVYRGKEARELCNIRAMPTAFAIDAQGFIQHVQIGFTNTVDHALYKFATE